MTKRAPAISNVHVDCVSHDATRAAAGFTFGEHRFHVWFEIKTLTDEGTLFKNPIADREPYARRTPTIKMNPTAAKNVPLIAEMWRQIKEGNMIAEAVRIAAYEHVWDDAEHDNSNFDQTLAFRARAREVLVELFNGDPAKISPEYVAPIVAAMEWAQTQ